MSINLQAKSVRVILTKGMDVILIDLDMPTTFPTMDYVSSVEIKTEYDCGVEWCRKNLNVNAQVINSRFGGR
jgi:hypothetical protein